MTKIILSGASTDFVEIDGDIDREESLLGGVALITVKGDTRVALTFTDRGFWKAKVLSLGSGITVTVFDATTSATADNGGFTVIDGYSLTTYSDRVVIEGEFHADEVVFQAEEATDHREFCAWANRWRLAADTDDYGQAKRDEFLRAEQARLVSLWNVPQQRVHYTLKVHNGYGASKRFNTEAQVRAEQNLQNGGVIIRHTEEIVEV